MADGDEHALDVEVPQLARVGVLEGDGFDGLRAVDGLDHRVPGELDLRVAHGAIHHDLGGAQFVATVDDDHLGAEAAEERGLLDGGVTAADHGDGLVAEEGAVAGGAPGHAAAGQALLVGEAELAVAGAHGEDDGLGVVLHVVGVLDHLDLAGEVDGGGVVGDEGGAEALGLPAHLVHEVRAHDALGEAGVVLHLGGVHQGAAALERALEHHRLEVGAGGVDGRGVAGGAGADDDDVVHGGHASPSRGRSAATIVVCSWRR